MFNFNFILPKVNTDYIRLFTIISDDLVIVQSHKRPFPGYMRPFPGYMRPFSGYMPC